MHTRLDNRADIDGMRAYAVLAVLFYHVGYLSFSGGFVGVDVFFVISGFLITRLIRHEINSKQFSFSGFYIRRVRRLFPAMFVTISVTLVVSYFFYAPEDYERLAGSAFYAVLSLSNVFFWFEAGYFDAASETKALLHTWSLSVEEQFYLIWPLSLFLLLRIKANLAVPIIALVVAVVGLIATQLVINIDRSAAFYLLPFRLSEFAVGIVMVWLMDVRTNDERLLDFIAITGLILVAVAIFTLNATTPFPGISSMLPCIGTAMMIYGGQAKRVGILFRNKVAVRIGLISYSLYLVHWPIFVLYSYYIFIPLTWADQLGIVIVSIVLAELMYRFIETPFRKRRDDIRALAPFKFGLVSAFFSLLILVPSINIWLNEGLPNRFKFSTTVTDLAIEEKIENQISARSNNGPGGSIIFLGDSIMRDFHQAFLLSDTSSIYEGFKTKLLSRGGCRPLIRPDSSSQVVVNAGCRKFNAFSYKHIEQVQPELIFIYSRWGGVEKLIPEVKSAIQSSVQHLMATTSAQVVFVDYPPDYSKSVMEAGRLLYRMDMDEFHSTMEMVRNKNVAHDFDNYFKKIAKQNQRVHFLQLRSYLCPDNQCIVYENDQFLIRDQVHLSSWGKLKTAKAIDLAYENNEIGYLN